METFGTSTDTVFAGHLDLSHGADPGCNGRSDDGCDLTPRSDDGCDLTPRDA
jgi:hypothetical protein